MSETRIYLTPHEATIIGLAIGSLIEDQLNQKLDELPWNPDARKAKREMLAAAKSVAAKWKNFYNIDCDLGEYNEGDEKEFFTKQS